MPWSLFLIFCIIFGSQGAFSGLGGLIFLQGLIIVIPVSIIGAIIGFFIGKIKSKK